MNTTTLRVLSTSLAPGMRRATSAQAFVFASWNRGGLGRNLSTSAIWSTRLAFASPESDFTTASTTRHLSSSTSSTAASSAWSGSLSFASPESDFVGARSWKTLSPFATAPTRTWSETLSFASAESDFVQALEHASPAHHPLPLTWAEALHNERDAIVITTAQAPHKVVHVNNAWEHLCGYGKDEALYKPIGPLLQNQEHKSHTNQAARHLMHQLQADHFSVEHDAYLENFTKEGRPFLNHVRVGPLYMEQDEALQHGQPEFLVAILEEVKREQVPLRMVV